MLKGAYDWPEGIQIRAYSSLRRKMITLYNSQGEETVSIVTDRGGNLNEMYEMHIFSDSDWMTNI